MNIHIIFNVTRYDIININFEICTIKFIVFKIFHITIFNDNI